MGRRMLHLVMALVVAALSTLLVIPAAGADNAGSLLGMVNNLRASRGLGSLAADPALTAAAVQWSGHMAAAGAMSHNGSLGSQIPAGWTKLGENVGAGGTVAVLFNALVASPFHLANMLDPSYTLTGIGVVAGARGTLWLTQDFEAGVGSPGTTTPAPVTTSPPPTTLRPVTPGTTTPTPVTTPPTVATAPTTAPPVRSTTAPAPSTTPPDTTPLDPLPADSRSAGSTDDSPTIKRTSALAAPTGAGGGLSPAVLPTGLVALFSLAGITTALGRRLGRRRGR